MTVTLRCLNCGFSFTITYPSETDGEAGPIVCGHCRSTHWSSHNG